MFKRNKHELRAPYEISAVDLRARVQGDPEPLRRPAPKLLLPVPLTLVLVLPLLAESIAGNVTGDESFCASGLLLRRFAVPSKTPTFMLEWFELLLLFIELFMVVFGYVKIGMCILLVLLLPPLIAAC